MKIDQIWVQENIDEIMNIFCKINPDFNVKDNASHRAAKSRHKKKILEDMDQIAYRPIYYIARRNKDHLEMKHEMNELLAEFNHLEKCNHANSENLKEEKEKSRKLKEENSTLKKYNERLKKRIEELEKNIEDNK
jgi:predicted nuclease with TOPRIM domain